MEIRGKLKSEECGTLFDAILNTSGTANDKYRE